MWPGKDEPICYFADLLIRAGLFDLKGMKEGSRHRGKPSAGQFR